jgi:PAS domain S-box-containing protein
MWGYKSAGEMVGRHLPEFWKGNGVFQTVKALQQTGLALGEDIGKRKDGSHIDIQFTANMIKDEAGRPLYMLSSFLDITARKRAQEALDLEREKFRILIEESPLGASLIGKDGHYDYINPKFVEMFGYTLEDIPTGRDWFAKAHPDPQYKNQVISTWINDSKEAKVGESRPRIFHVRCKDGSEKIIKFRPVTMAEGDQFVIYEDVTEQKHLEAQLQQSQKMEAIGTLASGIAHDFNNILSAIVGNAEIVMLHELPKGHPAWNSIEQMHKAAGRATNLVRQILAFSRQKEEEFKKISIRTIVNEFVTLLRASLPATIEIHRELTARSDTVMGDPSRIQQVLMNLCTNAAHAMHKSGGILGLGLSDIGLDSKEANTYPGLRPGAYLRLSVSDTGQGMSPAVKERIFEPYFTTKQVGEGTGLGLAVVHGIVKSLNGAITVESKPGKGSVFNILFPKIVGRSKAEIENHETVPTGVERILMVDDEKSLTVTGKRLLEGLGYTVTAKNSSSEALEDFRQDPDQYDLVITDMTMPDMTGDKLAREIMDIRPDMPVILCTGYSELITEESAKEKGIRELVMKPLVTGQLAKTIRRVLDGSDGD